MIELTRAIGKGTEKRRRFVRIEKGKGRLDTVGRPIAKTVGKEYAIR